MAATIRAGLVRLAPDPRLGLGASRARALAAGEMPLRPIGPLFDRTLFTSGRLASVERQLVGNRRCW
jgi:hypothetical protein